MSFHKKETEKIELVARPGAQLMVSIYLCRSVTDKSNRKVLVAMPGPCITSEQATSELLFTEWHS